MPYSNVLLLTISHEASASLARRLGAPVDAGRFTEERYRSQVEEPLHKLLAPALHAAHLEVLAAHFPDVHEARGRWGNEIVATTPAGRRTFHPFEFYLYGDEGECGDAWPTDFLPGVSLVSRYKPTFLDWRDDVGTAGDFVFNAETMAMIEEARTAIAARVPEFAEAIVAVKFLFY